MLIEKVRIYILPSKSVTVYVAKILLRDLKYCSQSYQQTGGLENGKLTVKKVERRMTL